MAFHSLVALWIISYHVRIVVSASPSLFLLARMYRLRSWRGIAGCYHCCQPGWTWRKRTTWQPCGVMSTLASDVAQLHACDLTKQTGKSKEMKLYETVFFFYCWFDCNLTRFFLFMFLYYSGTGAQALPTLSTFRTRRRTTSSAVICTTATHSVFASRVHRFFPLEPVPPKGAHHRC
jgi:hypothetical protein